MLPGAESVGLTSLLLCSCGLQARAPLDTVEKVDAVLRYITPAIKDEGEVRVIGDEDRFEFEQEQHLVARMFHLIANEDTDVHFALYSTARKFFGQGGTQRIEYTLPALVFGSLQLALRIHARESGGDDSMAVKTKKIFGFIHETISVLTPHFPDIALRLFMHAAQISDRCAYDAISYEYVVQAFTAYEEEIADSKAQFAAIIGMVASLQTFAALSAENWDTLVTKSTQAAAQRTPQPRTAAQPLPLLLLTCPRSMCRMPLCALCRATQHCAKLLKKPDQCRAVYQCAHVFWPLDDKQAGFRDEKRVLACLQRSLKIANGCMGQQLHLFVEILNQYLYFYDRGCPSITVQYLRGLISLIEEQRRSVDDNEQSKAAKLHYDNTLLHIQIKQQGDQGERYQEITTGGEAPISQPQAPL